MNQRALTPAELAARVRGSDHNMSSQFAAEVLEDWKARGIAEERLGRWRLTKQGQAMFGGFAAFVYPLEEAA